MTILLQSVQIRHEQRIRLIFTNSLAAGAFGAPAPSYYTVTCDTGGGVDPDVQAAFVVPNSPGVVELGLQNPLVKGALYTVKAEGVPALDTSTTAGGTQLQFRWSLTAPKTNVETTVDGRKRLLYGVDLIWNEEDFQESANGDLDQTDGPANVSKALNRAVEANGVPWDASYGAGAREFVDSPSILGGTLKGSISAQILKDPRVKEVKMSHLIEDEKTFIFADPILISGEAVEQVSVTVPNQ